MLPKGRGHVAREAATGVKWGEAPPELGEARGSPAATDTLTLDFWPRMREQMSVVPGPVCPALLRGPRTLTHGVSSMEST